MIVDYTPRGEEGRRWHFDPDEVMETQAEMIEKRWGGGTFFEWVGAVKTGNARARRTLLWHLLSREHHTLRFEDVDTNRKELTVRFSSYELDEIEENLHKTLTDGELETALRMVESQREESRFLEEEDGVLGKGDSV